MRGLYGGRTPGLIHRVLVADLKKQFKFIIHQYDHAEDGAGMFICDSCYWDRQVDGHMQVAWQNDTMHAIVSVYALAVLPSQDPIALSASSAHLHGWEQQPWLTGAFGLDMVVFVITD